MNVEKYLSAQLAAMLDVPVSPTVPANRPARFVTVELTGGEREECGIIRPNVAVQSWASTRKDASELADVVDKAVRSLPDVEHAKVTHVEGTIPYNYPQDEHNPRYQAYYNLVAHD